MKNREYQKLERAEKRKRKALSSLLRFAKPTQDDESVDWADEAEDEEEDEDSEEDLQSEDIEDWNAPPLPMKGYRTDADAYDEAFADSPHAVEDDKIRITMLGSSGSGKTSFLSGVYQTLILHHRTKLYLQIDGAQKGQQHRSIAEVAIINIDGVSGFMTSGTTETKTYDLKLVSSEKEYCKFEFWDYRGALVNAVPIGMKHSMERETVRFREQLKKSDVILVFADSIKISQYQNVDDRRALADGYLMSHIFTDVLGDRKYHIILVLTKSDDSYVKEEDRKDNFAGLRKKALETFDTLASQAKSFITIPVSAVGEGKADTVEEILMDDSGKRVKRWKAQLRSNVTPKPENIDLVIMYACRDVLSERGAALWEEEKKIKAEAEALAREISKKKKWDKEKSRQIEALFALAEQIKKERKDLEDKIEDITNVFKDDIQAYL